MSEWLINNRLQIRAVGRNISEESISGWGEGIIIQYLYIPAYIPTNKELDIFKHSIIIHMHAQSCSHMNAQTHKTCLVHGRYSRTISADTKYRCWGKESNADFQDSNVPARRKIVATQPRATLTVLWTIKQSGALAITHWNKKDKLMVGKKFCKTLNQQAN